MKIKGKVWKFGDNINTDDIIPAKYLNITDSVELGKYCMDGVQENFSSKVSRGDIILGGENFGCGSSREHAPRSIKGCGISGVVACSFARIFYRNAINIGLPIVECPGIQGIIQGSLIEVDFAGGEIKDLSKNKIYRFKPFPQFMQELINQDGLMKWINKDHAQAGTSTK